MKFLRMLHTGYGLILFTILFILFFPFLLIPILFPSQFRMTGVLNRWWARLLFIGIFVPFRVQYRGVWQKGQQYIFCPNHFSYLDIPTLALARHNSIFVGKSEMENIPLFGFMYRKLHITVDRGSLKSRLNTIKRSLSAIDDGKNLVIFPEGGIVTEKEPVMSRFKDGAFRVAIEKQIPLVPVTIPYNWIILPPDEFLLRWHPLHVIFHEPIQTTGLTLEDLDTLKDKVFAIIKEELTNHIAKTT
jgi:1-acyl-sn-glycerol-3-phosphate acyltransferase